MKIDPYLFFDGRCEEAIEFYKKALNAKVEFMMRNSESPEPPPEGMLPPSHSRYSRGRCRRSSRMMSAACGELSSLFSGWPCSSSAASAWSTRRLRSA